ncbi:uncharacterized protein LOC111829570, partial [Capsella rubella]|uniref:uncharacterized protein LOC111829570 n=1 Tax=Capsella rubella TaxID=81985 RepID=UPI000CD4FF19
SPSLTLAVVSSRHRRRLFSASPSSLLGIAVVSSRHRLRLFSPSPSSLLGIAFVSSLYRLRLLITYFLITAVGTAVSCPSNTEREPISTSSIEGATAVSCPTRTHCQTNSYQFVASDVSSASHSQVPTMPNPPAATSGLFTSTEVPRTSTIINQQPVICNQTTSFGATNVSCPNHTQDQTRSYQFVASDVSSASLSQFQVPTMPNPFAATAGLFTFAEEPRTSTIINQQPVIRNQTTSFWATDVSCPHRTQVIYYFR